MTLFEPLHKTFKVEHVSTGAPYYDILFILLTAVIAFMSGYLVTGCYQLAPKCIPEKLRDENLAKQASFLTVAFSIAAVGGLCTSFALKEIVF